MMISQYRTHEIVLPTLFEVLPSECDLFNEARLMSAAVELVLENSETVGLGAFPLEFAVI